MDRRRQLLSCEGGTSAAPKEAAARILKEFHVHESASLQPAAHRHFVRNRRGHWNRRRVLREEEAHFSARIHGA